MASRGSNAWRLDAWGDPGGIAPAAVAIYDGAPKCQVRRELVPAVRELGLVFLRHGYVVRRIGGYNVRKITGGSSYSSHSWGISVDVNDDTNPYRLDKLVTDMSPALIQDVYRIHTAEGVRVWRWGGDWDADPSTRNSNYDAMHFECIATPAELAVGFLAHAPSGTGPAPEPVGVPGGIALPSGMALHWPLLRRGSKGSAVSVLQRLLVLGNTTGAGEFGPRTEQAVQLYQSARGMNPDGVVGPATWTALLTDMPPLPATALALAPQKGVQ